MSRVHEAMQRAAAGASSEPLPPRPSADEEVADAVADPESSPLVPSGASDTGGAPLEHMDESLAEKVVIDAQTVPTSREQYRRLAAILHDGQATHGTCVVMVASAVAGEGKTLTACNLALTLSESYRTRVLLVDADLRKPTLHRLFQLNLASGLSDALEDPSMKLVLRQVSPYLSVLPGGRPSADPMAALTSIRMRELLTDARRMFDWVIIDTAPLVLLPDAHLLSGIVDGTVLVIRADSTPRALVSRAVDAIGRQRVIGTVLNQATAAAAGSGYPYAYGAYGADEPGAVATPS